MATDRFGNEIAQPAQPLQSGQDFDRFGNPIALKNDVTEDQEIGAGTYAAALGTEIAIAESIKFAGATVLGPIGYVGGALGGGALGSIQAQRMTNPNGEISIGRVIADSFINLLPASKLTKGAKTVGDVAKRTAGAGAAIGVGGVTIEKGIDASFCKCYFYNTHIHSNILRKAVKKSDNIAFLLGLGFKDESKHQYKTYVSKAKVDEIVKWR